MQLKLIDLFKSIRWAKNGDLTDFSQTNYEAGWAHLGDDTPTVQDFNYVQAMNDQKDQWLFAQINEVLKAQGIEATEDDLPALKRAIENLVTAKSTPKTITANTKNGFDETGHTHEIDRATTAKAGIVQLTNDHNGNSETLGLTQKAGKALKALIDSLTRNLSNYIPNSKKSSSISSASSDTVATSAAVKSANDNANLRVNKSGDTMTGTLTVPHIIVNDPNNNNNSVQVGDDAKFIDVDVGDTVGLQSTGAPNKGYIAYGTGKKRFGFDGYRFLAESSIFTAQYGHSSYAAQYTSGAPYMVEEEGSVAKDTYHPFIKGKVRGAGQYGTAFSFGYTTYQGAQGTDGFGRGVIHLIQDNGLVKIWNFEHNGNFNSSGDVITGNNVSLNAVNDNANSRVSKSGDTMTGGLIVAHPTGSGAFSSQWGEHAPFFTDAGNANGANTYYPYVKGRVLNGDGWGTALSFGYVTPGEKNKWGQGVVHLIQDNGEERHWWFNHNGNFNSSGDVITGDGVSLNNVNNAIHNIYQKIGNFEIRRYPDGTMIQTYVVYQNDLVNWHEKSFNWAHAFIETPLIFSKLTTSVNGTHDAGINILNKSNHATCYYWEYEHSSTNQGDMRIQFLAIGKWR